MLQKVIEWWVEQFPTRWIARVYAQAWSPEGERTIQQFFMMPLPAPYPTDAYYLDMARSSRSKVIASYHGRILQSYGLEKLPDGMLEQFSPPLPAQLNPAISSIVTQAKEPLSVPPDRSRVDADQCSMIDTSGLVVGPLFAKEHFPPDPALSLEDQKRWNDKIGMMVKRQVASGKITAVRGEFPHGRAKASYAFGVKGRAVFYQINHNRPGWKNCPDCPHGQV